METILLAKMIEAMADADIRKFIGYAAIFFVLWLEVRGIKKQLSLMNVTITKSFEDGDKRFQNIEAKLIVFDRTQLEHEHRLTALETTKGIDHGPSL